MVVAELVEDGEAVPVETPGAGECRVSVTL
jgi:hypothetical protein